MCSSSLSSISRAWPSLRPIRLVQIPSKRSWMLKKCVKTFRKNWFFTKKLKWIPTARWKWNASDPKRRSDWPGDVGIGCLVDSDCCDLPSSRQREGRTAATSHGGREGVHRTCRRHASFTHMAERCQTLLSFGNFCTKILLEVVNVEQRPHRMPGHWSRARREPARRAFWRVCDGVQTQRESLGVDFFVADLLVKNDAQW